MALSDIPLLSGGNWLGHIGSFRHDPLPLLERLNRECGGLGRMRMGAITLVVANEPAVVAELLVEKASRFRKSRLVRTVLQPLLGEGLFTSEGDVWKRQRRLMAPVFHASNVASFGGDMTDAATRCIDRWRDGDVLDMQREATRITMDVAGKTLFGADTLGESDELGAALTTALAWAAASAESAPVLAQVVLASALEGAAERLPVAWRAWAARGLAQLDAPVRLPGKGARRAERALRTLEARVARMIAEHREAGSRRHDLLARLLGARDDESGARMTDRQLRDEVLTLFVAGYETTATALAWSLYLLARHPSARARVEAEAAAVEGVPRVEDLPRLSFATRVVKEALRLYPPVPFYEREALEDVEIGGHRLPRGTYAAVIPWALHHRAELWPDPYRFDPDRFAPEPERARPRYAWVPFGAGPRVCIGAQFALQEGALVLASLMQRARFDLATDAEVVPDPAAATFRPLGGVPMRVTLRAAGARARPLEA